MPGLNRTGWRIWAGIVGVFTPEYAKEAFAKRKAAIEAQFSSWDGSHPSVEKMVKRGMKNPDSCQHVETKYVIKPNGFVVVTTIRGTNSFGGNVPQTFRAVLDDSGNVLSLTSAD